MIELGNVLRNSNSICPSNFRGDYLGRISWLRKAVTLNIVFAGRVEREREVLAFIERFGNDKLESPLEPFKPQVGLVLSIPTPCPAVRGDEIQKHLTSGPRRRCYRHHRGNELGRLSRPSHELRPG